MKRCPECDSSFPDTDQFCEFDGTPLVADYSDRVSAPDHQTEQDIRRVLLRNRSRQDWQPLAIIAVGAIAIGIVLFLIYQGLTRETTVENANGQLSNVAVTQPGPLAVAPSPLPSESPSPEPSPSVSPIPSPATQAESARAALSTSPVSTGGDGRNRRGRVTIHLTDGTSFEADDAWETREGIWYRRGGVVTLLERDQVKTIEQPSPVPSPSVTPSPASGASP